MKNKCNLIIGFLLLAFCTTIMAQQVPVFSLARYTPVFYNPAAAGLTSDTRLSLNYRQQWDGFNNAPETFLVGIDGRFNDKMGAAMIFYNDVTDIYGQFGGYAYYSYRINLSKDQTLALGISAGLKQNRINFDKIKAIDPTESSILGNSEAATRFDEGAGMLYKFRNIFVQFSVLQLFNQGYEYELQSDFKSYNYQLINHLYAVAGYTFQTKDQKFRITPEVCSRNVQGATPQVDLSLTAEYLQLLAVTFGFRQSYNFYYSLNLNVWQNFNVAFAYEMPGKDFKGLSYGTHEIMLIYKLSKRGGAVNERITNRDWKQMKQQNQQLFQETEQLQLENERLVKQLAVHDSLVAGQSAELKRLKEIFENSKNEVERVRSRYEINLSEIDSVSPNDTISKQKSFYLILGSYLTIGDAKFFQKVLERDLGLQTMVFTREDGKYFFVYSNQLKNKAEIYRELRRLKRMKIENYINGNIWIYGEK